MSEGLRSETEGTIVGVLPIVSPAHVLHIYAISKRPLFNKTVRVSVSVFPCLILHTPLQSACCVCVCQQITVLQQLSFISSLVSLLSCARLLVWTPLSFARVPTLCLLSLYCSLLSFFCSTSLFPSLSCLSFSLPPSDKRQGHHSKTITFGILNKGGATRGGDPYFCVLTLVKVSPLLLSSKPY